MPKNGKRRGLRQRWSKGHGSQKKRGNKNNWSPKTKKRRRLLAKKEIIDARLAALDEEEPEPSEEEDTEQPARDEYENRVVVKFYWKQLGKPVDPDEWKGRDGVISVIRRRMGKGAPEIRTVERTLQRLVEDENDDLSSLRGIGRGAARIFSEEDDMYVGLL